MSEQIPHVEVLSRNRVSRSTIIVAVVPVTIFSLVLVYALWSYLWWIAIGVLALLTIGALYLVALLAIDIYRRLLHARIVHLGEHGALDAANWRMLPLALPAPSIAPVSVTEEKPTAGELEVLTLLSKGDTQREVATKCGISQTKVSEIKRRWQTQTGMVD